MKKPKITIQDLIENIESMENANDWMLEMFKTEEIRSKDPTGSEFLKVYKGAVCQSIVANVFRSLMRSEKNRELLKEEITLCEDLYHDFDDLWEGTEA